MSLKEQLKAAKGKKIHPVDMSKFKGFPETLYVKTMSGRDIIEYGEFVVRHKDKDEKYAMPLILVKTVCDESGELLFEENDLDTMLDDYDGQSLMALYQAALHANYFTEQSMDEVKKN
ncbi:MAG: hypothetical protein U0929_16525 [Planctomycetaceae bacterium]